MLSSQPLFGLLLRIATGALSVLSLGRRNFRYGDYHAVFEKRREMAKPQKHRSLLNRVAGRPFASRGPVNDDIVEKARARLYRKWS